MNSERPNIPKVISDADREGFAAFLLRTRAAGVENMPVMAAIEATARREFVEPQYHHVVFGPRTIPIGCGQTVEGLDLQARMIHELRTDPSHRVLEIGTGSGYTAGVLSKLVKRVRTIERFRRLQSEAAHRFMRLGMGNIVSVHGDGSSGTDEGPYDRIIAWAAFESVPRVFIDQLISGGTFVCAIGIEDEPQKLVRMTKVGSRFEREDIGTVRFQPIIRGLPAAL